MGRHSWCPDGGRFGGGGLGSLEALNLAGLGGFKRDFWEEVTELSEKEFDMVPTSSERSDVEVVEMGVHSLGSFLGRIRDSVLNLISLQCL